MVILTLDNGPISALSEIILYFKEVAREGQLQNVGTYNLTNYYGRKTYIAILIEDNAYKATYGDSVLEQGKWIYEVGGDYSIATLQHKGQLGFDDYAYVTYYLKYP